MAFCSSCGTEVPEGASFCPKCGRAVVADFTGSTDSGFVPAPSASTGLSDKAAGALAYITIIPAIVFLLIEPYKRRPFVRFHAYQSIFLCLAAFVVNAAIGFAGVTGFFLGVAGLLLVVKLGFFIAWLMAVIKAWQGQRWELPVIGAWAKQQAGA